jgi:hypothetical protein
MLGAAGFVLPEAFNRSESGLAELSFLVPPSSLAKTHKNGLLAVLYTPVCKGTSSIVLCA